MGGKGRFSVPFAIIVLRYMAAGYEIIFIICTFHLLLLAVESSDDVTTRVSQMKTLNMLYPVIY